MNAQTELSYDSDTARGQCVAQLNSLAEMLADLEAAQEQGDDNLIDEMQQRIYDDPLSIEIRPGWRLVGADESETDIQFRILLCTGGPAVQVVGDLDEHNEPCRAWIEYQDWGTPWTELVAFPDDIDRAVLLDYARHFYFGE